MRRIAIAFVLCLAASLGAAPADRIDQATRKKIEQKIKRLSGSEWKTLYAETTFHSEWKKGAKNVPQETGLPFLPSISEIQFKTWLKKPNKVRIEITRCSIPLLNGMILIQNGKDIFAYDSISERTITSDLSLLFGSNPEGIGSTFGWLDFMSGLNVYDIQYHDVEKLDGKNVYHTTLRFKDPFELFGLVVDRDEVYIDPEKITMLKEVLYASDGKMLATFTAKAQQQPEPGFWIPKEVESTDRFGGHSKMTLRWIGGKVMMPVKIEKTAPKGLGKAEIEHTKIEVDKPMPDSVFEIKR